MCCRADLILVVLVTVAVVAFKGAVVVVGRLCGLKVEQAGPAVAATVNHVRQVVPLAVPAAVWHATWLVLATCRDIAQGFFFRKLKDFGFRNRISSDIKKLSIGTLQSPIAEVLMVLTAKNAGNLKSAKKPSC